MSCTDIAKYFLHFLICRGTVFAVPWYFCFGTFCPKVKALERQRRAADNRVWGCSPTSILASIFAAARRKISSVFTLELLAKNASVTTLALLAD